MHCAPLFLLSCLAVAAADPVTVRVQDTRGGPQIHVGGKPIPPRFFFGSMNSGVLAAKLAWTTHSFEFVPGDVQGTGTLHFRFAHEPGEIWLADLRIQDAKTSEDILPPGSFATPQGFAKSWEVWPVGRANSVGAVAVSDGALHVTLKRPPHGAWPDFHLHSQATLRFAAGRSYRCTFRARPRRRWISASRSIASSGDPGTISAARRARSSARSRWPAMRASTWSPSPRPTAGRRPRSPLTGRRWTRSAGRSSPSTPRCCSSRASPPTPRTGGCTATRRPAWSTRAIRSSTTRASRTAATAPPSARTWRRYPATSWRPFRSASPASTPAGRTRASGSI